MGDRTSVRLTVLTVQAKEALAIVEASSDGAPNQETEQDDGTTEFMFEEVNYGELDCCQELADNGIAYDSRWSEGSEFSAGRQCCRFTPEGERVIKELYDSDDNPPIDSLMALISDPPQLVAYITEFNKNRGVEPLDVNQAEYGKRYRVMRMLK